jgi:hypothetical protein
VRDNLWNALQEILWLEWREQYLWTDAICINQDDLRERGHQVNMMKDIFFKATRTVAWLGLSSLDSNLAMDAIEARSRTLGVKDGGWRVQKAIESLVQREYFERMWIVQEVLLSRNILVFCGNRFCRWDEMASFILNKAWPDKLTLPGYTNALLSRRVDRSPPGGNNSGTELHTLICQFHTGQCSYPRDSVYALLALVTTRSEGSSILRADYEITSEQLYYRTLAYLSRSPMVIDNAPYMYLLKLKLRTGLRVHLELDRPLHVVELVSSNYPDESIYEIGMISDDYESVSDGDMTESEVSLFWKYRNILRHVEILCGVNLQHPFNKEDTYDRVMRSLSEDYLRVNQDLVKWKRFKTGIWRLLQDWSNYVGSTPHPVVRRIPRRELGRHSTVKSTDYELRGRSRQTRRGSKNRSSSRDHSDSRRRSRSRDRSNSRTRSNSGERSWFVDMASTRNPRRRQNLLGTILLASAAGAVLYVSRTGPRRHKNDEPKSPKRSQPIFDTGELVVPSLLYGAAGLLVNTLSL